MMNFSFWLIDFCWSGAGSVDYILEHAEIDFVFVQDKKVKQVRT